MSRVRTLNVGLLGCGTVGTAVLNLIHERASRFTALDTRVNVIGVLVRDASRERAVPHGTPLTEDPDFISQCDVIVEVMGGVDLPLHLITPHLKRGRPVVTANKAMLALRWEHLQVHARAGLLHYEASVMAGTPVLSSLASIVRASRVQHVQAILNATCTFVLRQMEAGLAYEEALTEAQRLGYAEEDPTLDVSGMDAAQKLVIIARLVAGSAFDLSQVNITGIMGVERTDVQHALESKRRIKLLAELRNENGRWMGTVAPTQLPEEHPFCQPTAGRNALWLRGDACGELLFTGGSAGGMVTASAVVGDLLSIVTNQPGQRPLPAW